jgi:hypothetical protein
VRVDNVKLALYASAFGGVASAPVLGFKEGGSGFEDIYLYVSICLSKHPVARKKKSLFDHWYYRAITMVLSLFIPVMKKVVSDCV